MDLVAVKAVEGGYSALFREPVAVGRELDEADRGESGLLAGLSLEPRVEFT